MKFEGNFESKVITLIDDLGSDIVHIHAGDTGPIEITSPDQWSEIVHAMKFAGWDAENY